LIQTCRKLSLIYVLGRLVGDLSKPDTLALSAYQSRRLNKSVEASL
jgi:hypothetical protein